MQVARCHPVHITAALAACVSAHVWFEATTPTASQAAAVAGAPQSEARPALYQEEFVKTLAARKGQAILQQQRAVAKQRGQKKKNKQSGADSDEAGVKCQPSAGSSGSGAGKRKQAAGLESPALPAAKRAAACSAGPAGKAAKPVGQFAKQAGKAAAEPASKAAKPVAAEPASKAAEPVAAEPASSSAGPAGSSPADNDTPGPASSSSAQTRPGGIMSLELPAGAQRPPGTGSGLYSWTLHCPTDAQPTSTIIGRICVMPKRTAFYVKPVDVEAINALDGPGMLKVDKAGGVHVAWGSDVNKAWEIARWAAGWGA